VRHKQYRNLDPDRVVKAVGGPCAVIDCFCLLDDAKIRRYFELGCEVKVMNRLLLELDAAFDIMLLSRREYERDRAIPGTLARYASREGIVLYVA